MDEDLKIVLATVLEADEDASSQRILAQLPNIQNKINGKSSIKIHVGLDDSVIRTETQRITKQMQQASSVEVGLTLRNLDAQSIQRVRGELSKIGGGVDIGIVDAVTKNLDKMLVRVDKVTHSWEIGADNQKKLLNLTVQGVTAEGQNVSLVQQYNAQTGQLVKGNEAVTANLKEQRDQLQKITAEQAKQADERLAYATKIKSQLSDMDFDFLDNKVETPILNTGLRSAYEASRDEIIAAINDITTASGKMTATERANIESMVADHRVFAESLRNTEYIKGKSVEIVKNEELQKLDVLEEKIKASDLTTDKFKTGIQSLRTELNDAFDVESLNEAMLNIKAFQNETDILSQRQKQAQQVLDELIDTEKRIADIDVKLQTATDSDRRDDYTSQRETLVAEAAVLGQNLVKYNDILVTSSQLNELTRARVINENRVKDAIAKSAAEQQKQADSAQAYATKQQQAIDAIQASWTGKTSAKPVLDEAHTTSLENQYNEVVSAIKRVETGEDAMSASVKANIDTMIAKLKTMTQEYRNVEYVATQLRTKTVTEVKSDKGSDLAQYEDKLKSIGLLTEENKGRIEQLRRTLDGVGDSNGLIKFMDEFDRFQNDIDETQQKIRALDGIYKQMAQTAAKLSALNIQMVDMDNSQTDGQYNSKKYAEAVKLQGIYQQQLQTLREQAAAYSDVSQFSTERQSYEQKAEELIARQAMAEGQLADRAEEAKNEVRSLALQVEDAEARMSTMDDPPESLIKKLQEVKQLLGSLMDTSDADEILDAKGFLDDLNKAKTSMSEFNREYRLAQQMSRNELRADKLKSDIEKANAELKTTLRTWSALTRDKGLEDKFNEMSRSVKNINSEMDMKRWRAEFNALKAEVKAAGLNMKSMGDTIKENLGKVTQWASATTILFKGIEYAKRAIVTIIDLDTAMIDLRKTTDATDEQYARFYSTANNVAKSLGVTTQAVIEQTAEWSRLGYTLEEASKLAENSAIFEAVSPEMTGEQATDGLISIIKAYGFDVEDTLDGIISKINKVGNEFAVTNADVVDVMTRSSAAMAAANNSFDETVALATAA